MDGWKMEWKKVIVGYGGGPVSGRRRVRCDEQGILKALRGGQSYRQVAREHGVSLAKVQRVRAEASAVG